MSGAQPARHRTAVLVSGNGSNLQAIIDQVKAGQFATRIVGVVSDRPNVLALERARREGIPDITLNYAVYASRPAFCAALADRLDDLAPDLVVLAGFMRILTPELVLRYAGRMLNVHPSLLPKYPGLNTHRRVLEAGDTRHGSTVHFVTSELDCGPALIQYRLVVRPDDTEVSLKTRVQRGEHVIYPQAIGWMASGRAQLRGDGAWLDGRPLSAPVTLDESDTGTGLCAEI
jgi:phosphoribosylglycinamide formyltransferase-1